MTPHKLILYIYKSANLQGKKCKIYDNANDPRQSMKIMCAFTKHMLILGHFHWNVTTLVQHSPVYMCYHSYKYASEIPLLSCHSSLN